MKKSTIYIFTLLFILHLALHIENCMCQWVQQTLPVAGSVYSIVFFDQNTGLVSMDSSVLLRTTNGGSNWNIIKYLRFGKLRIINDSIVYALRGNISIGITSMIYRSFNRGIDWDSVAITGTNGYTDIYFFNKDTGLIAGVDGGGTPVTRKTTNGGITTFTLTYDAGWGELFFLKNKINGEYYGWNYKHQSILYKTTNSGLNWQQITGIPNNVRGLFFLNKDTGWISNAYGSSYFIGHTTNGGVNWIEQQLPYSDPPEEIYFSSTQKGWAGWSTYNKILATSNSGQTWGWQYTPTFSSKIFFLDSLNAWCGGYSALNHTTNGGGIINKITNSNEQITNGYKLYQNYPNPFNAVTSIKYNVESNKQVELIVYDILGKEIAKIINEKQKAGTYELTWNASNYSTGVYFYTLFADGIRKDTKKMLLIK